MKYISDIPNDKKLHVVVFSAEWCGHCRELKPELEKCEQIFEKDIDFSKIDVDKASNKILDQFKVDELPLIVAIKNGKEISRYNEKDGTLESWCKFIQW